MPKPRFRRAGLTPQQAQKARDKARAYIEKGIAKGDILPDLPGPDLPLYSPVGGLVGRLNPLAGVILGLYAALENTEQFWGPRLWEGYGKGYPDPLRPEAIMGVPGVTAPSIPETRKVKRKASKANKAFTKAYAIVTKGFKGKMTQKKCRYFMRKASTMASKANPHTKSRIGKSKNAITRHCRKIRKGVWGVTKHG